MKKILLILFSIIIIFSPIFSYAKNKQTKEQIIANLLSQIKILQEQIQILINKEKEQKETYRPTPITKKIAEDQIELFSVYFPFSEKNIKKITCAGRNKDYIFKNNKIIFPLNFTKYKKIKTFSCFLTTDISGQNKTYLIGKFYRKKIKRKTINLTISKKYTQVSKSNTQRIKKEY